MTGPKKAETFYECDIFVAFGRGHKCQEVEASGTDRGTSVPIRVSAPHLLQHRCTQNTNTNANTNTNTRAHTNIKQIQYVRSHPCVRASSPRKRRSLHAKVNDNDPAQQLYFFSQGIQQR